MSFKRIFLRLAAFALSLTLMLSLGSCRDSDDDDGKKGLNGYFIATMSGNPDSLDPQTCTNDSSAQVIMNVFRGLYKITDGGGAAADMAKSVTVSDDGLVFTFTLSDDAKWYGKDGFSADCTADDFVFAFQRLFDPALRSARAKEYYCIKNAAEYNTGKLSDPSVIGVEAVGKYELRITLTEPRTDIETLLAAPPAMPCNREYFGLTEGQYGLVGDLIGSNGAFYVKRWHYDKWVKDGNFIELRRNELNADALGTAPRAVDLYINADEYETFLNGKADVCRTSHPDEIFRLSGRYPLNTYSGGVWGILFNTKSVFADTDLRIALGGYVNGEFDGNIYSKADCMIPDNARIGSALYRVAAGMPTKTVYSEQELLERGERAMRSLDAGALSGMSLTVPEGTALRSDLGNVIQQWQKNFGVYCMISEIPASEHLSALAIGNFEAAAVRLGGRGAVSYLDHFSDTSVKNYGGFSNRKFEDILKSAYTASDDLTAAAYCIEAEQFVLDNCWFVPLCFENEHVFYKDGVSGIGYDPATGALLFESAMQK